MRQDEKVVRDTVDLEFDAIEFQHPRIENAVQGKITAIDRESTTGRIIATFEIPAYDMVHMYQIGTVTEGFDTTVLAQEETLSGNEMIPFSDIAGVSELTNASELVEKTLPFRQTGEELVFVVSDGVISETPSVSDTLRPNDTDTHLHQERISELLQSCVSPTSLMVTGSMLILITLSESVTWLTVPMILAGVTTVFITELMLDDVTPE